MGEKGKPCCESGGAGILNQMPAFIIYSGAEIEDKLLVQVGAIRRDSGGWSGIHEVISSNSHEEHFHDNLEL